MNRSLLLRILLTFVGEDRLRRLLTWMEIHLPGLGGKRVYAEFGEDIILDHMFQGIRAGFYVDVGAHHPIRESNTYRLYRRGWHGINIDASPGSFSLLQRFRPRDINLHTLVSNQETMLTFYCFGLSSMNTLDLARAEAFKKASGHSWSTLHLHSRSLADILATHVPAGTGIDLLSVDVEGHDLSVLQSNDWERFVPRVILVEMHFSTLESLFRSPLFEFLREKGYDLVNILGPSLVFVANKAKNHPHWPFMMQRG
ncbi:MAG: FkbM family methyltransferase [Magnetococcales bacterium]|nr:FkbM family methyltransferase [Magnetococcales bacterium]